MSQNIEIDPFKAVAPTTTAKEMAQETIDNLRAHMVAIPPVPYERADADDHHLGHMRCCIHLVRDDRIGVRICGSMARFLPDQDDGLVTPASFDFYSFADLIKSRFKLGDGRWSLFATNCLDSTPRSIATVDDLVEALGRYEAFFQEAPAARHTLFFFVFPEDQRKEGDLPVRLRPSSSPDPVLFSGAAGQPEVKPKSAPPSLRGFVATSQPVHSDDDSESVASADSPLRETGKVSNWAWLAGLGQALKTTSSSTPNVISGYRSTDATARGLDSSYDTDDDGDVDSLSVILGEAGDDDPQPVGVARQCELVAVDPSEVLPTTETPSEAEWERCCSLLRLVPGDHKDPGKRTVAIPDTDIRVGPSQYYSAFRMLTAGGERGIRGGLLAHEMGVGKTYVCITLCLLRAYIAYNAAEVEREWEQAAHEARSGKASPKKHLPRETTGHTPCPCDSKIECFANPGGVTRQIATTMSRGVSLIQVGAGIIGAWIDALEKGKLNRKYYEPVAIHTNVPRALTADPNLKKKLKVEVRSRAREGFQPKDWQPTVFDADFKVPEDAAKDPGKRLERYIIVASHHPGLLKVALSSPFSFIPIGSRTVEKRSVYSCKVGVQLVDEFHRVMGSNNPVVALAREHRHMWKDGFDFWAVTGTPVPNRLLDLKSTIELLQQAEWDDEKHPQHATRLVDLEDLSEAHEATRFGTGSPEDAAAFRAKAARHFRGDYVIRHTKETCFFDKFIVGRKSPRVKKVSHHTPDRYLKAVQEIADASRPSVEAATGGAWGKVVDNEAIFEMMFKLDILSTFPGAARLMREGGFDFTLAGMTKEIRAAEKRDVTKAAAFQAVLDEVIADSPKLGSVSRIIDSMLLDKTKRPFLDHHGRTRKKGDNLTRKKMVIICPRLAEAVFLFLAIRKLHPEVPSVFLHGDYKDSEKQALFGDFQSMQEDSAQILVSSYKDGGTGHNLFAANYQIQAGPMRVKAHEEQAFGRTNREGQQLWVHHFLLQTVDNPRDRIVDAAHAGRSIVSDPFQIQEEVAFR